MSDGSEGSVHAVGVDVGRWVEGAATRSLSEHEALLEDSPRGFEGASDSGSGRANSTGSSRAGSSEGRRGPVYLMKMHKSLARRSGGRPMRRRELAQRPERQKRQMRPKKLRVAGLARRSGREAEAGRRLSGLEEKTRVREKRLNEVEESLKAARQRGKASERRTREGVSKWKKALLELEER
ncbi:hypothetical protein KFL_008770070 [Klebsormidium nitens]|uniref:Uncharacterized protein n=1 Tax=Klebsormidium nitens TaxID=105231 RepID=A0A1Y1ISX3_KLENI|nr:hypothetical protein KFL_008770070 [Klebsormidium nitens]|eukprot:GAQ91896.1 hypothetical protein KFL_008770070 [Klebsormidium nitens]